MTDAPRTRLGDSDLSVFPLNLGGNVFGWTADEDESFRVLDAYAEAGGNFIDTADVYSAWKPGNSGGESEAILGRWMASRGNRSEMVIATKVGMLKGLEGSDRSTVRTAVDASLERLGTDYIDLYYAHRDFVDRPVDEAVEALSEQVELGKVRAIGISNISGQRLEQAARFSESENLPKYAAVQNAYSLVNRAPVETGDGGPTVAAVSEAENVAILPYSALASGFLTGKYRGDEQVDTGRDGVAARYLNEGGRAVLAALDEVAASHGTAVSTVALAWLLSRPGVAAPIASARTLDQLPSLLDAVTLTLEADEVDALTSASEAVEA